MHIMPLVVNSPGGGHTNTPAHTDFCTETILRNHTPGLIIDSPIIQCIWYMYACNHDHGWSQYAYLGLLLDLMAHYFQDHLFALYGFMIAYNIHMCDPQNIYIAIIYSKQLQVTAPTIFIWLGVWNIYRYVCFHHLWRFGQQSVTNCNLYISYK